MDGTFGTAPHLFTQIFTIHAYVNDKQLPLAYVLMTGKSALMYETIFQGLMDAALLNGQQFQPTRITSDFESGLKRAISNKFLQVTYIWKEIQLYNKCLSSVLFV